jgi:hypothetical protein
MPAIVPDVWTSPGMVIVPPLRLRCDKKKKLPVPFFLPFVSGIR